MLQDRAIVIMAN